MSLWLSELLEEPSLGATLVAGAAGLDRRCVIRWAHISELPDPTPWLEGGELLLTTGLGIRGDQRLQARFVAGLAERGVVGLGISMGVSLDTLPPALAAACEQHQLPLFTMPYEIPFIAVSRLVAHHSFEQRYATLRAAIELHRRVLATVVTDGGLGAVLTTVSRTMPSVALVVLDFQGGELARSDPDGAADDLDAAALWPLVSRDRDRVETTCRGRQVTGSAIRLGEHREAVVLAVSHAPLLEHEQLLLEQGVAGVSIELARDRSVRDARRARVDELLEEVAAGRSTAGLVARALERLGSARPRSYRVLAFELPDRSPPHGSALCAWVEDVVVGFGPPIVGRVNDTVHALVDDDPQIVEALLHAAERRGWNQLVIGRSRTKRELEALRSALREAGVALRLDTGQNVRDVGSLGLPGLLAGIRNDLGAADFVTQVLGPVIERDSGGAQLVSSLQAYLAHGCRPGPAAEELGVHRHTLAYRLDRIRDLTGRDPRSGAHLVEFGLALELLDRTEG